MPWEPRCVYSSPSTGDLLVAMYNIYTNRQCKVVRYNSRGEKIQTIQYKNIGQILYSRPLYITENRNGDVIVSDAVHDAVVVTDCGGRHRFSYTGPPSGSQLLPKGICVDALSHILVCDLYSNKVQMIDQDGHSLPLTQTQHGVVKPGSVSYDNKTHLLWVGSRCNNTVNIYRCCRKDLLTGKL
ncbi:uncharacterized protein LOC134232704 [Saccostrea cucullata]|uniref:uncharacterized protein LOC134232704 n=1 Tax=Saccostrea cuccullata TaxID=36930 RepID=UPI002ED52B4E